MIEQLDRLIVNDEYLNSFIEATVTLEIEAQSEMNYGEITFLDNELYLSYCYKIFSYWFKKQEEFTVEKCANATSISRETVRKIHKKHLM